MARHKIRPIPQGYTIINIGGKFYPMKVEQNVHGSPLAYGFEMIETSAPVSYARRAGALAFIESYARGILPWVRIARPQEIAQELPRANNEEYRQFLDSVVDDQEYTAYIEHAGTPRASEY